MKIDNEVELAALALGPFVLIAIGWTLLWVAASRESAGDQTVRRLLNAAGAVLLITGVILGIIASAQMVGVFLLLAASIITAGAVARFYAGEHQSLLWVLTLAAERGIPLESAARAFAAERHDIIGQRANLLADYLEAGVPLALALNRSRCSVTPAAQLAADLGQQTGTLAVGLRQATSDLDEGEATLRGLIEKLFYVLFLLAGGTLVVTFIVLKITPVISRLMSDFDIQQPQLTRQIDHVIGRIATEFSAPLAVCSVVLFAVAVLGYVGVSLRRLPLVRRLWWSADCGLVMHWLAVAVRRDMPLGSMVRLLAVNFPQANVRKRLERASKGIDRGQDWCDALRAARILRTGESGLFKAAERAGNLAWALDEMAHSGIRRSARRIQGWTNVLFPMLICGFGAAVMFICLGTLLPLVALVTGLS